MNKIYIIIGIFFVILSAYFTGARIASEKCRADIANQNLSQTQNLITIKGNINEETNNIATVDIRLRLRDKYTIKD